MVHCESELICEPYVSTNSNKIREAHRKKRQSKKGFFRLSSAGYVIGNLPVSKGN
jgi:hypothetical protein